MCKVCTEWGQFVSQAVNITITLGLTEGVSERGFPSQILGEPHPHKSNFPSFRWSLNLSQPTLFDQSLVLISDQFVHSSRPIRALSSNSRKSIQPSRATFKCEGINDSGQEIPHLTLIKFLFQNPHA